MGVFEWIGIAEIIGLAALAVILWAVARRRDRADRGNGDIAASATIGTAAVMMHDQPDIRADFGGGDAGGM